MKKIQIGMLTLLGLMVLSACGSSDADKKSSNTEPSLTEETKQSSSEEVKTEALQENAPKITQDELKNLWINAIAGNTYDDNYIGNITYNITPEMNEDTFSMVKEFTKAVYNSDYDNAVLEEQTAIDELKQHLQGDGADIYFETLESLRNTQKEWVKELRSVETKEQALALKEKIDNNTQQYSSDSMQLGMAMRLIVQENDFGLSTEEQTVFLTDIIRMATEKYGDPTDAESME
ncbi:hypothetical protein ACYSNR_06745 [Enterococcus sp. LJL128]